MLSNNQQPEADQSVEPILEVNRLRKYFPVKGGVFLRAQAQLKAVDDVSLSILPGETLGLVGESGCGKSTLGKCVCRLHDVTEGSITFKGNDLTHLRGKALKPYRRNIQMIFQDPAESLNSRHSIGNILEEPLLIHGIRQGRERRQRVAKILDTVGLPKDSVDRFPFEFSGGQRQRIGIARAISLNPELVVCDEPVSALDVSVQSQILNLMLDLQKEFNLSYLFIAHDLAVVKHISDRIAIMYMGKIVELGAANEIFKNPLHAYTKALISAIPVPEPHVKREKRILLKGDVPSPIDPPPGCAFSRRSWIPCTEEQMQQPGEFKEVHPGHWVEVHPGTVENYEQYAS
ncbi:ABC transporter ATP-binding protein [Puniceicoccales bacterium CK1056]|uniref:ABC transporter ATP-binding protein n=1 Tax=Oceanipulchritudo coccoides TaxID=2706888 RepID=A0A6B2M4I6_9BACT|nr:ABC transporter ATP-binding protein [Oceanipulchritudo coccoides]NDV62997.1 ABC transporter ATP-binding protein [Oceanipulchritudo coccoides]